MKWSKTFKNTWTTILLQIAQLRKIKSWQRFICFEIAGRRRYRCDTDHREYCNSLLERYEVPPAEEAGDDNDDNDAVTHNEAQVQSSYKM